MLERMSVVYPTRSWNEQAHGRLATEFPSIFIAFDVASTTDSTPHLSASEWERPDFDSWSFDCRLDALASEPFTMIVADDDGGRAALPLEVLNRCQRLIGRRNRHSQGQTFDLVLRRHCALHDLDKPLVRADYNHALDVWQWVVRLDSDAPEAVQLAALFHDVERLVSEADVRVEHLASDYQSFKDAHARRGAELADEVLASAGVAASVRARVAELVAHHERPSDDRELALLNDADALSFFSLNSDGYASYFGREQTAKKVAYTWNRLSAPARERLATVRLRVDVRGMVDQMARE